MSVVDEILINPTTGQAQSKMFSTVFPRTIMPKGGVFGENEGAKIQIFDGALWHDLYFNNILQEITAKHTAVTLLGPVNFRIIKSATVASIGITSWWSEDDA